MLDPAAAASLFLGLERQRGTLQQPCSEPWAGNRAPLRVPLSQRFPAASAPAHGARRDAKPATLAGGSEHPRLLVSPARSPHAALRGLGVKGWSSDVLQVPSNPSVPSTKPQIKRSCSRSPCFL